MAASISIVIPVYNGSKFLSKTIDSLVNQTFKDFEVICINDASSDNSVEILKKFQSSVNIKLIDLKKNIGFVSKIIKEVGLPNCTGKYFLYMSQDDLLSSDCLMNMFTKQEEGNVDAVIPDLVYYSEGLENQPKVGYNGDRSVEIKGLEAFKLSLDWQLPGCALIKTKLLNEIGYEDFNMYADEYNIRKYYLASSKVGFCEGTFFYRTDNPNAITKKVKPALFQKQFKEAKLLDLVYHNLDYEFFMLRFEQFIISYYDNYAIIEQQNFNKKDRALSRSYLAAARQYVLSFIKKNGVKLKFDDQTNLMKWQLVRYFHWFFVSINKVRFGIK